MNTKMVSTPKNLISSSPPPRGCRQGFIIAKLKSQSNKNANKVTKAQFVHLGVKAAMSLWQCQYDIVMMYVCCVRTGLVIHEISI